jgi:hypothetical protein
VQSFWVAAEIAAQVTPKDQAAMIEKFVTVSRHCLGLQNFFSVFAVVGALDFENVRKLKDAWLLVSKKVCAG